MQRQDYPLTQEDFAAVILAMQSLGAFVFFNRGFLSGMSILHKHLQVIPFSSMGKNVKMLPVERHVFQELGP